MTATRSTAGMMPATLNFRAALSMLGVMNAIAQVSASRLSGPKLDNRRVLAAIVDLLIVTAGALVVLYAGDAVTGDRQGALTAVILGWALYYYFALESGAGQTVGKKLMKLRVVCADGRPAGMREIAVRTILRVIDGIGVYIVGLVVMLVTGERRQRIGDLAAGTIVVDASGPATAVAEPAAPEAEADEADEAPVAAGWPTDTITLPTRPTPPEPLFSPVEAEVAEEAEPVDAEPVEAEPVVDVEPIELESVVPVEPTVEVDTPAVELDSVVPVEPTVEVEEPTVEVEEPSVEAEEPGAEQELPSAMSPSLEGLVADVAAVQGEEAAEDADRGEAAEDEDAQNEDAQEAQDDEPVNVKSVETVSAMDLIMGAAEEDSAKSDEDEPPASA
jgi:uncharacterized RDD family membrane protein YckC